MTTNIKRFADTTANRQDDSTFEAGRGNGFVAGTIASSAQANKALFNVSSVTEALASYCDELGYSINDYSSLTSRKLAIRDTLIRVASVQCDDVVNTRIPDAVVPGARWQSFTAEIGNPIIIPNVIVKGAYFAGVKCIFVSIPNLPSAPAGNYIYRAPTANGFNASMLPSLLDFRNSTHGVSFPLVELGSALVPPSNLSSWFIVPAGMPCTFTFTLSGGAGLLGYNGILTYI